ncbi:hypothetical protein Ddye_003358 [Dipteronia dyeriana]|uniref:DUF7054 domain-containing protein n=1 Tax=Dipteronia dyeriana TaxID=168575 RepID=A0AAD9XS49_9ROSI|nr:hypothetical protein Ddye_003358 [Dipteronia dyeriana]
MSSLSHLLNRRHNNNIGMVSSTSNAAAAANEEMMRSWSLQVFPPERYTDLVRRRGGLIYVPARRRKMTTTTSPPINNDGRTRTGTGTVQRLTKLLLNVNIERSLGPVQVVTSPEKRVSDLIKAAIEIYVKEKRRPLLKHTDFKSFQLHYSQYSLESLKADEKLINLGSRNFFMCSRPSTSSVSVNPSSCSEQANLAITFTSPFPLTKFMDFLL